MVFHVTGFNETFFPILLSLSRRVLSMGISCSFSGVSKAHIIPIGFGFLLSHFITRVGVTIKSTCLNERMW